MKTFSIFCGGMLFSISCLLLCSLFQHCLKDLKKEIQDCNSQDDLKKIGKLITLYNKTSGILSCLFFISLVATITATCTRLIFF